MTDTSVYPNPDLCLLLRAHAEARWLSHEVVPVLHELERDETSSAEQLGAALAYLEVLWLEARGRAAETEASRYGVDGDLEPSAGESTGSSAGGGADGSAEATLRGRARRYHAAVRRLRDSVAVRMSARLALAESHTLAPCRSASTCSRTRPTPTAR